MKLRVVSMLLAMMLILLSVPGMAFAHTTIKSSVPQDGEVVNEPVEMVSATFAQGIQAFSTMTVLDEEGQEVEPASVAVEGKELRASFAPGLANGTYTAEWKVVADDGHTVTGKFAFEVTGVEPEIAPEASEPESPVAESAESEPADVEEPVGEPETNEPESNESGQNEQNSPQPEAAPAAESVTEEASNNHTFLIVAAVVILVIVAAGMILVIRKPRQS